jgi:hypothetical protein
MFAQGRLREKSKFIKMLYQPACQRQGRIKKKLPDQSERICKIMVLVSLNTALEVREKKCLNQF